jgi:hypothetical protein
VTERLARAAKQVSVDVLVSGMVYGNAVVKLAAALNAVQEPKARKTRYGDQGDNDPDAEKRLHTSRIIRSFKTVQNAKSTPERLALAQASTDA